MTSVPEIAHLLANLAIDLRRSNASTPAADGDETILGYSGASGAGTTTAISSLAASLNSDVDENSPTFGVLDAALSLMCFTNSEVYGARIEQLVSTFLSVLSSSVSCKVLRLPIAGGGEVEALTVGNSMSPRDCDELIRVCTDVLESLDGQLGHSYNLINAVLKATVSSSCYPSLCHGESEETSCISGICIVKLMHYLHPKILYEGHEYPCRLLLWCLDPLILKQNILEMLQELLRRPFLCLSEELHNQLHWREIIICLVNSPIFFVETRALLHGWLLVTGLSSILDLKIGIVSSVLDTLSRPVSWGLTVELGLKYPFSYAYFSGKYRQLLSMLSCSISCKRLLDLVCYLKTEITPWSNANQAVSQSSHSSFSDEAFRNMIDSDSAWSMMVDFPAWFYFSAALIFYGSTSKDHMWKTVSVELKSEAITDTDLCQAAAYYLSCILCPFYGVNHSVLSQYIYESSRSFINKQRSDSGSEERTFSDVQNNSTHTLNRSKKLRMPKLSISERSHVIKKENKISYVVEWLEGFNALHDGLCSRIVDSAPQAKVIVKQKHDMHANIFFQKITVGILIMHSSYLDKMACHILLHYAATGEIIPLVAMQKNVKADHDDDGYDFEICSRYDTNSWELSGACFVFNLLDTVQNMSAMLFDSEDGVNFVSQIKAKVSSYMIRCLRRFLKKLKFDTPSTRDTLIDIQQRLVKLNHQGREFFELSKDLNDFIDDFTRRVQAS